MKNLTKDLRQLAVAWSKILPSVKDRKAAIRIADRGNLCQAAAKTAVEIEAERIRFERRSRPARRIMAKCGHIPDYHRIKRNPVTLPQGTPKGRLDALRQYEVLNAFRNCYRIPDSDHGSNSVVLTNDPSKVGVIQTRSLDWTVYPKSTKYPAQITETLITVPVDWRTRVQARGLAVVDGLMTLDAAPLEGCPDGVRLYAATWLVQGRGYSVSVVRGYIAQSGHISYHGDTIDKTLVGLHRKVAGVAWTATLESANLAHIIETLPQADMDAVRVKIADAKAIGACDYGIRSWCYSTGLPYADGAAPLRSVWAAYQAQPRAEARAAILHALRRVRHHY